MIGYDGSYRSDFHSFNFYTRTWRQVSTLISLSPSLLESRRYKDKAKFRVLAIEARV